MNAVISKNIGSVMSGLAEQSGPMRITNIENLAFHAPWAARVFGVTLAAAERGIFSMQDFQGALIKHIGNYEKAHGCIDGEEAYYSAWVAALSDLLQEKALLTPGALAEGENKVRDALARLQHDHEHDHEHEHDGDAQHSHHHGAQLIPIFVEKRK